MTQFEKLDLLLRECGGTIQTFQVLNRECETFSVNNVLEGLLW